MDRVQYIKDFLLKDQNRITLLLEKSGFYQPTYNSRTNEIRCARSEDGNLTNVVIYCDNLYGVIYSQGVNGDIFALIMYQNDWSFSETLAHIERLFDLKITKQRTERPFSGYFDKYRRRKTTEDGEVEPVYSDEILKNYIQLPSMLFLKDQIDLKTQRLFDVCYDEGTSRVLVPWRDQEGRIVGIEGRLNQEKIEDNTPKWLAVIQFKKKKFLYGLDKTSKKIEDSNQVVCFESSKSVMKTYAMGHKNTCACGGNDLSLNQVEILSKMSVQKIILAFDEGIPIYHIQKQCSKFKQSVFYSKDVYYIFDKENKYLPAGSKLSPADLDKIKYEKIMRECCYKYEGVKI